MENWIKIDSWDERIEYEGPWGFPAASRAHNGTVSELLPNDRATNSVSLTFNGTAASVFGTPYRAPIQDATSSSTIRYQYLIDGRTVLTDFVKNATGELSDSPLSIFKLYTTPPLSPREHTLMVEVSEMTGTGFVLDYFEVLGDPEANVPRPRPSSSSTQLSPTQGASEPAANSGLKLPLGAIVGAAFGALFLVLLGILLWWILRRRQQAKKGHRLEPSIVPFDALEVGSAAGTVVESSHSGTSLKGKQTLHEEVLASTSCPRATPTIASSQQTTSHNTSIGDEEASKAILTLHAFLLQRPDIASPSTPIGDLAAAVRPPPSYEEESQNAVPPIEHPPTPNSGGRAGKFSS